VGLLTSAPSSNWIAIYPAFPAEVPGTSYAAKIYEIANRSFARQCCIDVIISNVDYSLFSAANELSDKQVDDIVATNMIGPIQFIRVALPHLRAQGGGCIMDKMALQPMS